MRSRVSATSFMLPEAFTQPFSTSGKSIAQFAHFFSHEKRIGHARDSTLRSISVFVVQASGGSNGFHAPEIQCIASAHIFGMAPSASHPDATHSRSMIPARSSPEPAMTAARNSVAGTPNSRAPHRSCAASASAAMNPCSNRQDHRDAQWRDRRETFDGLLGRHR